ncbi:MAG: hypothetical protein QXZ66_07700 [Thermoproteota archaeon]
MHGFLGLLAHYSTGGGGNGFLILSLTTMNTARNSIVARIAIL